MTTLEIILSMAIAVLMIQVLILQRHYNEKLAELSVLINNLLGLINNDKLSPQYMEKIKMKIFNSSQ